MGGASWAGVARGWGSVGASCTARGIPQRHASPTSIRGAGPTLHSPAPHKLANKFALFSLFRYLNPIQYGLVFDLDLQENQLFLTLTFVILIL